MLKGLLPFKFTLSVGDLCEIAPSLSPQNPTDTPIAAVTADVSGLRGLFFPRPHCLTVLSERWKTVVSPATIAMDLEDDEGGDGDSRTPKAKLANFLVCFDDSFLIV